MADPAARDAKAARVTPLVTPYQLTYSLRSSTGIVQGNGADWFGPLNPLAPIAPPEVRGRSWDFPSGWNVVTRPRAYELVGFGELRALAQTYDLLAIIIETRKDQLSRMEWNIVPKNEKITQGKINAPAGLEKRAAAITKFFRRPDGHNRWADWVRLLLDDLLIIDAPTLFCERTRGGQLSALRVVDGATFKRVIDDWGQTPEPPVPAYQQILKGLPAVNYTTRDIIYRPRNKRVHKAYGFSPVEQIMMTVNIALRRQLFTLQYFTEGNIPEALIGAPDGWTPDQIMAFQANWDAMLEGNLAARRHAKFVPGGVGKTFIQTKDPELKGVFDEWLARITCFAFSVDPAPFVPSRGMGGGKQAETAHDSALEEGLAPLLNYFKGTVDDIIESPDGFGSDDLEFKWKQDHEVDPVKQETIITGYVSKAVMSINEGRGVLGLDPLNPDDYPEADAPMVITGNGFTPINANTPQGKLNSMAILSPHLIGPDGKPKLPEPTAQLGPDGKPLPVPAGAQPDTAPAAKPGAKPAPKPGTDKKPAASKLDEVFDFAVIKEAGRSGRPFVAKAKTKRIAALSYSRPKMRKAISRLTMEIAKGLSQVAADVAGQVRKKLKRLGKADGDDDAKRAEEIANTIALSLDLGSLEVLPNVTEEMLAEIGLDSAKAIIAQLGVADESDLVDQINDRVVAWARARSAEMVGMRYNAAGDLVEAARAEYRVDDATRDMIRANLAQSLEDNLPIDDIVAGLQESTAFSEERAELIARTEITRANNQSSLIAATSTRDDQGLGMKKVWLTAGDDLVDEEVCQPNEDDGPIDLEDDFDSGDDAPPGHPRCRCTLVYDVTE